MMYLYQYNPTTPAHIKHRCKIITSITELLIIYLKKYMQQDKMLHGKRKIKFKSGYIIILKGSSILRFITDY